MNKVRNHNKTEEDNNRSERIRKGQRSKVKDRDSREQVNVTNKARRGEQV